MLSEHIEKAAGNLLQQYKGFTVSYVKELLAGAIELTDRCSFVFPYEMSVKQNPADEAFTASMLEEVSELRPEWFREGSSLRESLEQARLEVLSREGSRT